MADETTIVEGTPEAVEPTGDEAENVSTAEGSDQGIYADSDSETETEESATEEQEGESKETQADDDATGDEADKASDKQYEFTLPDGVELDKEGAAAFNELGHELGITQEQVNKLVEWYAERVTQSNGSVEDSMMALVEAQQQSYREESEVLAPEGSPERVAVARAVKEFGGDAFKEWVNEAKIGDAPELVRFCIRVGQAIGEDTAEAGDTGSVNPTEEQRIERGIYA